MPNDCNDDPPERSGLWSLREDVLVTMDTGEGQVRLHGRWGEVTIERPSPLVREALRRMRLGPISLDNVTGAPEENEASELYEQLDQLQPLVIRTLGFGAGQPLLSVVPLAAAARFRPVPLPPDAQIRLSTFAQLRTDGREYRLESPLALHRVQLHRPEAIALISELGQPVTAATAARALGPLTDVGADALAYLAAAGMVVRTTQASPPEHAGWSPVDLMFHTRSTTGRHDNNFGVTYPLGHSGSPEPVVRPRRQAPCLPLHRPRWEDLSEADPPLAVAMEGRRTVREHGTEPVTADELGDLLYRTARVRALITPEDSGPVLPGAPDPRLSDRPYPGTGACYELELYVTVGRCSGFSPGVYHYDPLAHCLEPVNPDPETVDELLMSAAERASMDDPPQLLITITARFPRISWKYEGMAYAAVLKDVGVLYQSLYLVCTAMHLAPCALGSVGLDDTARAFGTDWLVEPSVGQFIAGRAPLRPSGYGWRWEPVNDAQWADQARARLGAPVA